MKAIKRVKAFQNIFDILLFATHATQPFTMKDLHDYVLDAPNNTIQCYVQELIKSGYLEKGLIRNLQGNSSLQRTY